MQSLSLSLLKILAQVHVHCETFRKTVATRAFKATIEKATVLAEKGGIRLGSPVSIKETLAEDIIHHDGSITVGCYCTTVVNVFS